MTKKSWSTKQLASKVQTMQTRFSITTYLSAYYATIPNILWEETSNLGSPLLICKLPWTWLKISNTNDDRQKTPV